MIGSLNKEIRFLVEKEVKMEWRNRYAFNALLLYIISTVFICYLSFKQIIDPPTWNALFWIIMLFAAVNAIAKSFMQESKGRLLYYYSLVSPQSIILSKTIYNMALMMVLSLINLLFYSLFIGNIVQDMWFFLLSVLLGCTGFATILTMVSAIASKSSGGAAIMAILSFPVLIPLLITTIKLSKNAMDGLDHSLSISLIIILASINLLVMAMSFILFPYLWKE
jgi:heme exporter protein B